MKLKCIDNHSAVLTLNKEYDMIGRNYNSSLVFIINDEGRKAEYFFDRFIPVDSDIKCEDCYYKTNKNTNLNSTNIFYWYFNVKIKDSNGIDIFISDGVSTSDIELFPLRKVEEKFMEECRNRFSTEDVEVNYSSILQLSKEDYNWKYAQMSKFKKT